MEAMQSRNNFHQLIDSFSDVKMLEQLYEVISNFQTQKNELDFVDELTKAQKLRLKDSIDQAQKGKTVSHGEAKEKVKYWLAK